MSTTTTTQTLPPHALRKYADLIFTGSRLQWSFFDPRTEVACGDYGLLSEETGLFAREGNIYDEGFARQYGIKQPEEVDGDEEARECWTISKNARALTYGKEAKVPDADIQKCDVKGHITFSSDRGAVLVTLDARTTSIPGKKSLKALISEPRLHGKHLVSEVVHCAKYARYMSSPTGGDLTLGFDGKRWLAVGVTAEDTFQSGVSDTPAFFPLFRLQVMRDRGPILLLRDSPEPEDPAQLLAPLYPPWGALDERGEKVLGGEWASSEEDFMREVEEEERHWAHAGVGKGSVPASPPASI
ncbi:hypothetical protein CALVIDRAFT_556393 [Calocera viscosa TUFC12733]|uniref:Uncharacterized protein n=1 Tax=Calocera viscosa (strain TUFC12733) TaxID=1330018 RepID=A0A167K7S8_CALVF|nr:hypothetical protein CALVIDRAFT_556393 [Calocera viscosa TUFC12733]